MVENYRSEAFQGEGSSQQSTPGAPCGVSPSGLNLNGIEYKCSSFVTSSLIIGTPKESQVHTITLLSA